MNSKATANILVVDDEPENRRLLRRLLENEGYAVREAPDGIAALEEVAKEAPDLLLLDVMMPQLDGYGVCKKLKSDPATRLLPVLMLTSLDQIPDKVKALEVDADDYLTKPYHLAELQARVRSMLRLKHYTDELESASTVLRAMATLVERRDAYVGEHCRETAWYAVALAKMFGLKDESLAQLRLAASLHDLGKMAVPDAILHKPGPLDADERRQIQLHPLIGAELLEPMRSLKAVVPLVRGHHEKLDGSGYPDGLKGEQVSMELRILSVVDVYQALVATRPYKGPMPSQQALQILRDEAVKGWWDAKVVECLSQVVKGQ